MSETSDALTDLPLPPANFTFLAESIMMQTQVQLGILSSGDEAEKAQPNLPIASHSIELLGMLKEKTRGNLTTEEHRMLENGLTELRFRFAQVSEELKKKLEPLEQQPMVMTADGGKGSKTA